MSPVQAVEPNPALQSTIEELGTTRTQCDGNVQNSQRHTSHPQAADTHAIGFDQFPTPQPNSPTNPRTPARRDRNLHNERHVRSQVMPPRRGKPADRGRLAGPQRGCPDTGVVGELAIGNKVRARM
jgi:hypothetical protein